MSEAIDAGNATRSAPDDFIGGGSSAAIRLLNSGMNVNALRTNDLLRKEEWLELDRMAIEEATIRLGGVADLINMGLTYNMPNAMGTTILQWEDVSEMEAAERTMDGVNRAPLDRVLFEINNLPIYITHKDFRLNIRHLAASRKMGMPIDMHQVTLASRKVAESLDDALFNGGALTVDGKTVPGYTTHPNRNTYTLNPSWTSATGDEVIQDILAMIIKLQEDRMFGPYMMYINKTYWIHLMDDYKANSDKTIMRRILEIPGLMELKVSDQLSSTEVLMIQMTRDVVDLVMGEGIRTVQWETHGGFQLEFKVLAIMVPRIKKTQAKRSGICHGSE